MTLPDLTPPEGARKALIDAALTLFGDKGFDATSTRELAAHAKVNVALIAYHFGGKDGLRLACGHEIGRRIAAVTGVPRPPANLSSAAALDQLELMVRAISTFMHTAPEAQKLVSFMIPELIRGGPVLDAIYDRFISPKHAELCALWSMASGQPANSDHVRLSVFALIGQIAYFRLARPVVLKKMGWEDIAAREARQIGDLIASNLRTLLRGPNP
jgi:TetR/AcrR family transcriptional regulator, regulator of cefoperazone and chloramphenicol sensitivity